MPPDDTAKFDQDDVDQTSFIIKTVITADDVYQFAVKNKQLGWSKSPEAFFEEDEDLKDEECIQKFANLLRSAELP